MSYNETVMGTIDFQISYNKNKIPRQNITQLINTILNSLNKTYKKLNNEYFDIHFHLDNIEDNKWFELNGLIYEAYKRRNDQISPLSVIHRYLNEQELERFSTLSTEISKDTSK